MATLSAQEVFEKLANPKELWSYSRLVGKDNPVSQKGGVYGWYFKKLPPDVREDKKYKTKNGKTLLYVGSGKNLSNRMEKHRRASGRNSTLRRSLNVLFYEKEILSGTSDSDKKNKIKKWMEENAFVCFVEHDDYENIEKEVIAIGWLPLNIKHSLNPFSCELGKRRCLAKLKAMEAG